MRKPPELDEVLRQPRTLEAVVEPRFIDAMGHMNIAWYMVLFDRASWAILARIGLDEAEMQRAGSGAFAVEQTVRYFAELRLGARVDVYTRMVAIDGKIVRFVHTMVDVERRCVAATVDTVAAHVDRRTRRAVPFPASLIGSAEELMRLRA